MDGTTDHEREAEFRRLLDNVPAGAYMCDAQGLITWYNHHAVRMWGREPRLNDPADRFCGSFRLLASDGTPIAPDQCWMALAIQQDRAFNGQEILVERPDGERFAVLAHANPIHDASGRLVGAVNFVVDISERRRAEDALRESDRARNEFLATLAHELRNPLAPIRNAAKILDLQGAPTTDGQWALDVIDRQLRHMSRIIDDLVDVARITSNKLELRLGPISLAEAIRAALETSGPQFETAGLRLEVTLPTEPLRLDADHTRLSQAISNLLDNAARYTERGGRVWLEAERVGDRAEVRIRDTGIGISPERLGGIFDVFTKGDRAPDRLASGLGVGLTLARRLVELHGGTLSARSEGPGQGSEFVVRLPLLAAPVVPVAGNGVEHANGCAPSPALRVLVVDDNEDSATSLAMLLRTMNHEVRASYDGLQALQAAEEFRPQVVLLDIGLPGLSGYDVASAIRAREWGAGTLLIAITGWGQEVDRTRSRDAGFDHHLVKPMDLPVLTRLLERASPAVAAASTP